MGVMGEVEFSLTIPAYNAERYIREAVLSALADATERRGEIIVVDDGSTDDTAMAARECGERVRVIRKTNGGPGSARNVGVRASRGDIVLFLDADDRSLPGRLQRQVGFMLANPSVAFSFGDLVYEHREMWSRHREWGLPGNGDHFLEVVSPLDRLLRDGCYPCMSAAAIRRDAYLKVGGQREDVRVFEDYDLWCRLASAGRVACTAEKFIWCRRSNHSHLMASRHAYLDPPMVLKDVLSRYGGAVSPLARSACMSRFVRSAQMMLRYLWIEEGGEAVKDACRRLSPLLPGYVARRWAAIGLIHRWIPRAVRKAVRNLRVVGGVRPSG